MYPLHRPSSPDILVSKQFHSIEIETEFEKKFKTEIQQKYNTTYCKTFPQNQFTTKKWFFNKKYTQSWKAWEKV